MTTKNISNLKFFQMDAYVFEKQTIVKKWYFLTIVCFITLSIEDNHCIYVFAIDYSSPYSSTDFALVGLTPK